MAVHIIGETQDGEEVLVETCEYWEDAKERQDAILAENPSQYRSLWLETDES